jgi:transcriptional regulator with PAS, ATPase and Fis domain
MLGETGVGKERFAHMLHQVSKRGDGPFVAVNCGAIPDNLLESELFGVERGAYTGATESRKGRFERAEGGTLFLDEIGTLNEIGQVKLLRALQQKEIERIGDTRTRQVDVRVVAATNADLESMVREGRFRADLYYRLNLFPITIPPLRERRDDIPLLAQHFIAKYSELHGKNCAGLSFRALTALLAYDFPGNVRELENLIERGIILAGDGGQIELSQLSLDDKGRSYAENLFGIGADGHVRSAHDLQPGDEPADGGAIESLAGRALDALLPLDAVEDGILREAVRRCKGNLSASARMLGISRAQLEYRLKRQGTGKGGA